MECYLLLCEFPQGNHVLSIYREEITRSEYTSRVHCREIDIPEAPNRVAFLATGKRCKQLNCIKNEVGLIDIPT